ncbi:alpha/beta hydrolase [Sinimarinibacterium sp. CAU 1509]|uniref:alpha/beta fold hydrolase n=1 Tax=Sinimarinibacterium sp. CAU 1509 TaxID=2562283 RepID=UPI0010AD2FC0|nr:alpha/beta hydrolase [Sinimarinibacterium sp. CAU 1509]TJY65135.1 alpha/beta hydrolase [Sinimarinibacterium sp. CAU 1509]
MSTEEAIQRMDLGRIELAYLEHGQGPLVLCLHGFPDTAYSFVPVMQRIAAAGYRVVAPFMPGYAPSGLARDGDYRITTIAQDMLHLIDALGERRALLVGHDWGAIATYFAATMDPQRVPAVVTGAIPHLHHFLLRPTLQQLNRSRYIAYFQLRGIPERRIVADDFAWLLQLIRRWSPSWAFTEADLEPLKATLSQPAHLAAALAYYRALPGLLASRLNWSLIRQPLPVPAKVIYGSEDGCMGAELFADQTYCFGADYEPVRFEGAGHFMQCEQPERFANEVLAFLAQHPL